MTARPFRLPDIVPWPELLREGRRRMVLKCYPRGMVGVHTDGGQMPVSQREWHIDHAPCAQALLHPIKETPVRNGPGRRPIGGIDAQTSLASATYYRDFDPQDQDQASVAEGVASRGAASPGQAP